MEVNRSDRLVMRDIPILTWVVGLGSIGFGLNSAINGAPWQNSLGWVVACMAALAFGGGSTIVADRRTRKLTLTKRPMFTFEPAREFALDEIASIIVERYTDDENGVSFRLVLTTIGGEEIPFTNYFRGGLLRHQQKANRLREFLGHPTQRTATLDGELKSGADLLDRATRTKLETQTGVTGGIAWTLETGLQSGRPVTRWSTSAIRYSDGFFLLVQTAPQSPLAQWLGRLVSAGGKFLFRQVPSMLGIDPDAVPRFDEGRMLDSPNPRLADQFLALSNDPVTAGQMLNDAMADALAAWAARYPFRSFRMITARNPAPIIVLITPSGLAIGFAVAIDDPATIEEFTRLGSDLARAMGGHQDD